MCLKWVITTARQHKSTLTQPLCQPGNKSVSESSKSGRLTAKQTGRPAGQPDEQDDAGRSLSAAVSQIQNSQPVCEGVLRAAFSTPRARHHYTYLHLSLHYVQMYIIYSLSERLCHFSLGGCLVWTLLVNVPSLKRMRKPVFSPDYPSTSSLFENSHLSFLCVHIWLKGWVALWKQPNNHSRAHSRLRTILESQINLNFNQHIFGLLEEFPEKTLADTWRTCKLHTERTRPNRDSN